MYVADPERAARVAGIAVAHGRLRHVPAAHRRIALILTAYVAEAGYGQISREAWLQSEIALNAGFAQGQATGVWKLDHASCEQLASVVCVHDAQLHNAPLGVLAAASERLERLKAGEADPAPKLKRA